MTPVTHGSRSSWPLSWLMQWPVRWPGAIPPVVVLAGWLWAHHQGWVAPQVLPAPTEVGAALLDTLYSGELWGHVMASLTRVMSGFVCGGLVGLALGAAMGLSPLCRSYLLPSVKWLAQVPLLAWLPLLMWWLGIGEALKWVLVSKAVAVPVALNTQRGVAGVPPGWLELARAMGYSRWQTLWRVHLPAARGPVATGVRHGLTQAWLALVAVELLASSEGLGYLMVQARQLFQMDRMLAAVLVVGLLGWAMDGVLAAWSRRPAGGPAPADRTLA